MSRTGFGAVNEAIKAANAKRSASHTPTRIYTLFPVGLGFSSQMVDYHGTKLMVAATSIRQAYAVAHKKIWIDPTHRYPVGIVSIYDRHDGTTLWCGCSGHSVRGGRVKHGAGIRALRAAIDAHHCNDEENE